VTRTRFLCLLAATSLAAAANFSGTAWAQQARDPLLDDPLPDFDPGVPPELPPVAPPDPSLLEPLAPLASFDTAPRDDFTFAMVAEEGLRYQVAIAGLQPTGLEQQFRRLSALVRGQNRPATAAQIGSRARTDTQLMERLLFSEGWYGAEVDASIDAPDTGAASPTVAVRLTAVPSSRYHWRAITLDLIPDTRPALAEGFGLRVGDPMRAAAVEEAEGTLKLRLNRAGYPFAEIGVRDVVLDSDQPTGTYMLTGDIGPIGRIGDIVMSGFQPFDDAHAAVIARFRPGDIYNADLMDDFRRALIATQLFAGVTAVPVDSGRRDADGAAITEIRVQGNRGPMRRLSGQIGYSSGEGFRLEGAWQHRNLWAPEGKFTGRMVAGTIEQRAAAEMVKSNFRQRDRTLTLVADIANLRRPAYRAETLTLSAKIARHSTPIWQKPWTYSYGVELQASREEDRSLIEPRAAARTTFLIASLPLGVGRDTSDNLLDPQKGWRAALTLWPELSRQDAQLDSYLRAIADASYYRTVRDGLVIAGRLRAGTIRGATLDNIAPTRRLYAGGGGSVRGFDFQGIGPLGANDRPTGGRSLAEASLEGRWRFGDFGLVGFVDAGAVNESSVPSLNGTRVGLGVGARYFTGFGPMRLDIARAVNPGPRDPKLSLYISIGQAF